MNHDGGRNRRLSRRWATRRSLLRALGGATVGAAFAGCSGQGSGSTERPSVDPTRTAAEPTTASESSMRTYAISEGTDQEADVYVIDAARSGPTIFLVGGIHGDEESGWRTAEAVTEWTIDAGTLIVLPRANPGAVRNRVRTYPDDVNLNRQFPDEAPPETRHARELWKAVRRHDPDFVLDLHSSRGILALDDGLVGQNVFHSHHSHVASRMETAMAYLNESHLPDDRPDHYRFLSVPMPPDLELEMLVNKARNDLGMPVALFEVTEKDVNLETQIAWTTAFVEKTLDLWDVRTLSTVRG